MAVFAIIALVGLAAYLLIFQGDSAQVNDSGTSVRNSDGSITGSEITADRSTWPAGDKIWDIAQAIAHAEGYDRGDGYVPYDLNNPGDISDGASQYGSQFHGSTITTFPTAETGWQWLYNKLQNIVTGNSTVYPVSWSFTQVASKWAGDSAHWVANVTSDLGVSEDMTLADYVNQNQGGAGGQY